MRLLTNRIFRRWAEKEGLTNVDLCHALAEIEAGLIDADLGGGVIKNVSLWLAGVKVLEPELCLCIVQQNEPFLCMGFQKVIKPMLHL